MFSLAAAVALAVAAEAQAETKYWVGLSPNFSFDGSWDSYGQPQSGDDLVFRGLFSAAPKNDISATYKSVAFENYAGSSHTFTISGNIVSTNAITNNSSSSQTFSADVSNVTNLTIGNLNGGGLNLKQLNLVPYQVGVSASSLRYPTVTLQPSTNNISVSSLVGAGHVVVDGPGQVAFGATKGSLQADVAMKNGTTLAVTADFKATVPAALPQPDRTSDVVTPNLTMAGGTTLRFINIGSNPTYELGYNLVTADGTANVSVDAGVTTELGAGQVLTSYGSASFNISLTGSFNKTGGGTLLVDLNSNLSNASMNVLAGALRIANVEKSAAVASLAVSTGAAIQVVSPYGNPYVLRTAAVSGTGTVLLQNAQTVLDLTPGYSPAPLSAQIIGQGGVQIDGNGNAVNQTGDNSYTGGTRVVSGVLLVNNTSGYGTGYGGVDVSGGSGLGGSGRVYGTVALHNNAIINPSTTTTLGYGTATLTVGGLICDPGAIVTAELNGITAGKTVDQVLVQNDSGGSDAGSATITGARLQLVRLANFRTDLGTFTPVSVLKANGTLTGTFAAVEGVRINATQSLSVTYDARNAFVQLANAADVNLDGAVTFVDLLAMTSAYGTGMDGQVWVKGDLTGDGLTNLDDLRIVSSLYPGTLTPTQLDQLRIASYAEYSDWQGLHGVPEPAALPLIGIAAAGLLRRRKYA